jgi:beta-mannosidase
VRRALLLLALAAPLAAQPVPLHEGWTLRARHADVGPLPAAVPGVVHTALLRTRRIPDPFFGANEQAVAWVDTTTWVYARTVTTPPGWRAPVLVFDGLDTVADVRVDGRVRLRADNAFRRWTVPLEPGTHRVEVVFHPAAREAARRAAAAPVVLPESPRPHLRKPAYHFGWDWGPRFLTAGIWRAVRLEDVERPHLRDVYAAPEHITGALARYTLVAAVATPGGGLGSVRVRLDDREVALQSVNLHAGTDTVRVPVEIRDPRRWWPRGMGDPHRYRLAVEIVVAGDTLRHEQRLGVRTVRLDTTGGAFAFVVNGVPVFAKGANVAPLDSFYPVPEARTREVLQSAVDAGMNMVRVWGGGVYESDAFYALADSLGLMVWQDFMFGNAMYPSDRAFLAGVRAEAEEQVRRLRGHPSVVLWCGGNEIREGWFNWGWQDALGYTEADSAAVWCGYEALFEGVLPAAVAALQPDVPYWPSSPSHGWGRDVAYREGDVHYWGVWWGRAPFETYREKVGRFNSEYGFQAYPVGATVRAFADTLDEANAAFRNHQKHPHGFAWLREYAEMTWGHVPDDPALWRFMTQAMQAEGVGMAIAGHRAAKPRTMGTLYWQLNDPWPVVSWSSTDSYGRWKPLHYRVRGLYRPLFAEVQADGERLRVRLVSDTLAALDATVIAEAFDTHAGRVRTDTLRAVLPANGTADVPWLRCADLAVDDARLVVRLRVLDAGGREHLAARSTLASPWRLDLAPPALRVEAHGGGLTLTAARVALGVWLEAPDGATLPANYLDVFPGEPVRLGLPPGLRASDLTVRTLHDLRRP